MTPQQFVATWKHVTQTERATSQTHFNHLCQLLEVDDPVTGDPSGESYAFEPGVRKAGAGEARAVRWGDVMLYADDGDDPRAGVHGLIQVRSQVPIDVNDGAHHRLKSGSAARTVPISGRLAELMIAHRERIATYARRRDRSQWREAGYVWPRRTGGVATVEGIRSALALIADVVVLESRPTLHTLRHTWASHALDSGTPAHVVAAILGHSSIETTYEYYYDPTHQAYAAASLADYRKGRPTGQGHPRLH